MGARKGCKVGGTGACVGAKVGPAVGLGTQAKKRLFLTALSPGEQVQGFSAQLRHGAPDEVLQVENVEHVVLSL